MTLTMLEMLIWGVTNALQWAKESLLKEVPLSLHHGCLLDHTAGGRGGLLTFLVLAKTCKISPPCQGALPGFLDVAQDPKSG